MTAIDVLQARSGACGWTDTRRVEGRVKTISVKREGGRARRGTDPGACR